MQFILPDMNVSQIYTSIKGTFFETSFNDILSDMSYNIVCNANIYYLNRVFLFNTQNDVNFLNDDLNDLTDNIATDIKYSVHTEQWNPSFETTKNDRKYIIGNYLFDLFGQTPDIAIKNIDVLSNENELDNDISDIFQTRLQQSQKQLIYDNSYIHGAFNNPYDVNSIENINGNTYNDMSSTNINSLTYKLILQAYNKQKLDNNTNVFKRQFGIANNTNTANYLKNGWRNFIFEDGDTINFNLIIKQKNSFFPIWAYNQSALTGNSTPTNFSVTINIKNIPEPPLVIFRPLPQFVREIIYANEIIESTVPINYTILRLDISNETQLIFNEYGLVLNDEQLYDDAENRIIFDNIAFY